MTTTHTTSPTPRDVLLQRLTEDLIGPGQEGDAIAERPSDRYLTGILFPNGAQVPPNEDDGQLSAAGMDGDEADDTAAPITSGYRPSTCGLSFALTVGDRPSIKISVSCARYERFHVDPATSHPSTQAEHAKRANERWRRRPLAAELTRELRVDGEPESLDLSAHGIDGLELYLRPSGGPQCTLVTAALVNRLDPGDDRATAEHRTFFQVAMTVTAVARAQLTARPAKVPGNDRDAHVSALIYRGVRELAVGHTCSASWGPNDNAVAWARTEWLPTAVVRRMRAEGDAVFEVLRNHAILHPLSAKWLAAVATDGELVQGLRLLVSAYSAWLDQQQGRVAALPVDLQGYAAENLADCRMAATRMSAAVDLLESDPVVRQAWRLAAGAMNLQFRWTKRDRELQWHPFQVGFQLLVLPSLVDRTSPDREIMDLLWFPTGGGKTEAYLALTAFLLFYRRLHERGLKGCGTAVLMRYTLRLLTVQQFQRAAALILACEAIRRGHEEVAATSTPVLGDTAFSIGLWVGAAATPNNFEDAEKALRAGGAATPRQLPRCPRCGQRLDYKADQSRKAIEVRCSDAACYFAERDRPLPIWVVDSDVYRERPSLLIATLDKFTQIVRKPETRVLFGLGTPHSAPDLIIQDELHLISGPLGSLAGLYEVAIDRLYSRVQVDKLVRPKIIGSTATIRRAVEQVDKLFAREAFQFPPPVIDATNSGFGVEDTADAGRVYVGLTTAGRSAKFALQATYASVLQGAIDARIPSTPRSANPRDRYWTLTGYFNSLRELGGAVTLVMDDVLKSIRGYARRRGEEPRGLSPPVELNGGVPSSEIPVRLERLEHQVGHTDCIDVLLASNMISVGVDVSRLGLMVVAAQPKTVAEYIQATSRVGRQDPGLVVVVYNHPRVRDRSFFETFPTWHRALYRAVEATSVTPFASRARDRAMHAVVVALARHLVDGLQESPVLDADSVVKVRELLNVIATRVDRVDSEELAGVRRSTEAFVVDWERLVEEGATEYWGRDHVRSVLIGAEDAVALEDHGEHVEAWSTPNSMREVEPSALFRLWFAANAHCENDSTSAAMRAGFWSTPRHPIRTAPLAGWHARARRPGSSPY